MQRSRFAMSLFLLSMVWALLCSSLQAAPPALREQVLLNGNWPTGGAVPQYSGITNFTQQTFERSVSVPAAWTGKTIQIEFNMVNHVADVYVNNQLVQNHVGGWNRFVVDVTSRVTPGTSFALKVVVTGAQALKNANGKFIWPVGAWSNRGGIADDVWLRAYGKVNLQDTFIKTSVQNRTLVVDYTLRNDDTQTRTVTIAGSVAKPGGAVENSFVSPPVTLAAGETRTVTLTSPWANPTLYWPDSPTLYHLSSRVVEGSTTLDTETRRFGFREVTIPANQNQIFWNGIRINLYGDYQSVEGGYQTSSSDITPAGWPGTVDKIKAMNIRCLRWHHNPVPQYLLDVSDEKGLLICSESANYAREYLVGTDHAAYVNNFKTWCAAWMKADRNHPSIYLWNATNEMTYTQLGAFTSAECQAMGNEMLRYDTTRPIGYDGDRAPSQRLYNWHYFDGYNTYNKEGQSIYTVGTAVQTDKPTGTGENLHTRDSTVTDPDGLAKLDRNKWWLGIRNRGLRYTNWTDVRPACYWFAAQDLLSSDPKVRQRGINLRNAYAPVALFDKAYDDLGLAPYVTGTATPGGTLPTLGEGTRQNRTLILYNDEFQNTSVEIEVQVRIGSTVYASGTKTYMLALGAHRDIACTFQVPYVGSGGATLDLVLITRKNGVAKFEEVRRFTVNDLGQSGTSNPNIGLDNQAPSVNLTSPAPGASFFAPATVPVSANASDPDGTIATVEFFANNTPINTQNTAPYSFTWSGVAAGTYTLTARATDNVGATTTSGPLTITVTTNAPPTVRLTAPTDGQIFYAPANIAVNASANDPDGTIARVEFYQGTVLLGTTTAPPYGVLYRAAAPGIYMFSALAYDNGNATATAGPVTVFVRPSRTVLLVAQGPTLGAGDNAAKQRLEALGFATEVKTSATVTAADAAGKALVAISSSVSATDVNTKFRAVATPVLVWESYLFDDLGMTGPTLGVHYGTLGGQTQITITNPNYPLAAGLAGTRTVYNGTGALRWGAPNANAVVAAVVPGDNTKKVLFGYERGAIMFGITAPARRVGLFWDSVASPNLSVDGGALFEAAVKWAVGARLKDTIRLPLAPPVR